MQTSAVRVRYFGDHVTAWSAPNGGNNILLDGPISVLWAKVLASADESTEWVKSSDAWDRPFPGSRREFWLRGTWLGRLLKI